jgi:hypothetical protein
MGEALAQVIRSLCFRSFNRWPSCQAPACGAAIAWFDCSRVCKSTGARLARVRPECGRQDKEIVETHIVVSLKRTIQVVVCGDEKELFKRKSLGEQRNTCETHLRFLFAQALELSEVLSEPWIASLQLSKSGGFLMKQKTRSCRTTISSRKMLKGSYTGKKSRRTSR